jgi:hypothetical protein
VLLDRQTADIVAIAGAGVGLLGLLVAVIAVIRMSRLRAAYDVLQGGGGRDDFVTAVNRHVGVVDGLRGELSQAQRRLEQLESDITDAIRHVAVVRYDAFPDMGGRMSFSAAFLDDAGDGVVLTSINGRSETRTYAKGVKGRASEMALSPEEQQAIGYAARGPASR